MIRFARTWVRSNFGITLVVVTALGVVARTAYVLVVGPRVALGMDAAWYIVEARALTHGHGYVDPRVWLLSGDFVPTANFPPLWPVLLSIADRVGLDSDMRNQFVGVAVGSISIVVTGLFGRRIAGPGVGTVAAFAVACSPMLIAADGSLMAESLYVLLVLASVVAAYRALEVPSPGRFAWVGAWLGLAALTRSDALFLAPIMTAIVLWRLVPIGWSRRLVLGATLLAVFAVPVAAFSIYSSSRMGGIVLTTSNSGNVLTGANCDSTYSGALLGAWDERCASNLEPGEDEIAWAAAARKDGLAYAVDHVQRLPLVVSVRMLRAWGFWDPVGTARLEVAETRSERWQLLGWAYDMALVAAAGVGAVAAVRRGLRLAPMIAVVVGVAVAAGLSNGNQRFRLAAEPLLAVLAAIAVVTVSARRISREVPSAEADDPTSVAHRGGASSGST